MEPGETVEEAAIREVQEETGIECEPNDVRYVTSQAWPFPSQLMIGCRTRAQTTDIDLIDQELEDAKWFTRQEVMDALQSKGSLKLPPSYAIAHTLIQQWLRVDPKL
jgi:NAD+ diphosphatase